MESLEPVDPRIGNLERAIINGHSDVAFDIISSFPSDGGDALMLVELAGNLLSRLYSEFHGSAIEMLWGRMATVPSGPITRIRTMIQSDVEATMNWRRRLNSLVNERLSNHLVDAMKASNMNVVSAVMQEMVNSATKEEDRKMRLRQVGALLGGLLHERERSFAFVRSVGATPERWGFKPNDAMILLNEYNAAAAQVAARRQDMEIASMNTELTQTVIELSKSLPNRMSLTEPSDEQVATFDRQMRALLRCVVCTPSHSCLPEMVMILSEFAPRNVSSTAAAAGAEQRLYMTLGRTARLTTARVFGALGKIPQLGKLFLDFAIENASEGTRIGKFAVETLGVLHIAEAEAFLIRSLQARGGRTRIEAAYALGAISGSKALDALVKFLRELLKQPVLDVEHKRLAYTVIESIGRGLRPLPPKERNGMIQRLIHVIPMTETDFKVAVLLNFFNAKIDETDKNICEWGAATATELLWLPDNSRLALRGARTQLGWRQPLVDLLIRLMPVVPEVIVKTVESNLGRYCGAYLAVAELFGRVPTPEELPVLRQMVIQLAMQSEEHHGARDMYKQETYYDASSESSLPLTKDTVLASVVYAISQQKDEAGDELLSEVFRMAQSKRLPMPGRESAALLMEAHMKVAKRKGNSDANIPEAMQSTAGKKKNDLSMIGNDVYQMIDDLSASFMFKGKRRQKRVAALVGLAQAGEVRALPRMGELLGDADSVIAGAAQTAILDLLPKISGKANEFEMLMDSLLRELLLVKENGPRERIAFLLARMKPAQDPLRSKIESTMMGAKTPQAVKLVLAHSILPIIKGADEVASEQSSARNKATEKTDAEPDPALETLKRFLPNRGLPGMEVEISELDKKRAYMMARQEWIRNGKRGPEPQPPQ